MEAGLPATSRRETDLFQAALANSAWIDFSKASSFCTLGRCIMRLCGVTGEVGRLFDLGGFADEFLIFRTQADGIGKLQP